MAKSSIMIDLDDPRTAKIADVISNKTTKKILSLLAEQELSETELSKLLDAPLNTIEYNVKKLEESGLIEKAHGFFWSPKGKKVYKYKVSNKKIVISPKSIMKGVIPTLIVTAFLAFLIKLFLGTSQTAISQEGSEDAVETVAVGASGVLKAAGSPSMVNVPPIVGTQNIWAWFMLGALVSLAIFLAWNILRSERRSE